MSAHTPGPWTLYGGDKVKAGDFLLRQSRYGIGAPQEEWEANARLIATAPDLLDLARNVAGLDPLYIEKIEGPVLVVAAIREWIEQARAAIAKAEGLQ